MRPYQTLSSDSWDLGLSEIIEEPTFINPKQQTPFVQVVEQGAQKLFLKRPTPSWGKLSMKQKFKPRNYYILKH